MMGIFIFYAVLVMVGAFYPQPPTPVLPFEFNNSLLVHFCQYFVFAVLYYMMRLKYGANRKFIYIELFFIGAFISVITEEIQRFIPGRNQCWWDVVTNLLGFYSFIALSMILNRKKGVV
jgi:VanZ family protein